MDILDQLHVKYVNEAACVNPFVFAIKRFREDVTSHCVSILFRQVGPALVKGLFQLVD